MPPQLRANAVQRLARGFISVRQARQKPNSAAAHFDFSNRNITRRSAKAAPRGAGQQDGLSALSFRAAGATVGCRRAVHSKYRTLPRGSVCQTLATMSLLAGHFKRRIIVGA